MNDQQPRPIVCGTDFSANAEHAATIAAKLSLRLKVELILAHSIDEHGEIPEHLRANYREILRPRLEKEGARLRGLGAKVTEELLSGVPNAGVVQCAERHNAQFVVLAASGHGALGRWILGSVSERIAQSVSAPTIVVRGGSALEAWSDGAQPLKVFVASDFSNNSDAALSWAGGLRRVGPCEFTVGFIEHPATAGADLALADSLGVTGETPDETAGLERDLRKRARELIGEETVRILVGRGAARVDAQILVHAAESGAELIVVGTHQSRGLERLRKASISRRILRDAQIAVATIPDSSRTAAPASTTPVRRVLVATDLSEQANRAIPHAFSIVNQGGKVCVLFVNSGSGEKGDASRLQALVPLDAGAREIQSEVRVVDRMDVAEAICETAERFDADVVCVGSSGRTGLSAAVLGSVAMAVLARTTRPVLVVPVRS